MEAAYLHGEVAISHIKNLGLNFFCQVQKLNTRNATVAALHLHKLTLPSTPQYVFSQFYTLVNISVFSGQLS